MGDLRNRARLNSGSTNQVSTWQKSEAFVPPTTVNLLVAGITTDTDANGTYTPVTFTSGGGCSGPWNGNDGWELTNNGKHFIIWDSGSTTRWAIDQECVANYAYNHDADVLVGWTGGVSVTAI